MFVFGIAAKIMLICFLQCSTRTEKTVKEIEKRSHWHCCMCPQLLDRVNQFGMHLEIHGRKITKPLIPPFKDRTCTDPASFGKDKPGEETRGRKHIKTPVPKVESDP